MQLSATRILTTHAGSLPRPPELASMLFDVLDQKAVDEEVLRRLTRQAVADVVRRQREVGIDAISDGEMGKVGFSNYVMQHLTGFEGAARGMPGDLLEVPDLREYGTGGEGLAHLRLPILNGPIEPRDPGFAAREIDDFKAALDDGSREPAFIPAVTPGQVTFNFPNRHYTTHQQYLEAAAGALSPEYHAIIRAGFDLQLDSPDSAMAFHMKTEGSDVGDPKRHLAAAIDVLNDAISDLPPEKIRYHVCWGNYRGTHHLDVPLRDIVDLVLKVRAKFIYLEAANPRHQHEWAVWKEAKLPDDKALIVGVIDTKTNHVEHPELVAERIQRYAGLVGKERVVAGTDCGFATFVGAHPCSPSAAWMKLKALVEGAHLASQRLR
jgi:5-methyltetrahydropteroyltriglutamate--homocysteine methyltransferase